MVQAPQLIGRSPDFTPEELDVLVRCVMEGLYFHEGCITTEGITAMWSQTLSHINAVVTHRRDMIAINKRWQDFKQHLNQILERHSFNEAHPEQTFPPNLQFSAQGVGDMDSAHGPPPRLRQPPQVGLLRCGSNPTQTYSVPPTFQQPSQMITI